MSLLPAQLFQPVRLSFLDLVFNGGDLLDGFVVGGIGRDVAAAVVVADRCWQRRLRRRHFGLKLFVVGLVLVAGVVAIGETVQSLLRKSETNTKNYVRT